MVQESKLLKAIISKQSSCKSEVTYNFIHRTQNMLAILHFIIDDLVAGKNVPTVSINASELLAKYGHFLEEMKKYCHENGRFKGECNLNDAIEFALKFKKIHLREQKVQIENEVDPELRVFISPYDMAYALDELLPVLADTQSTREVHFSSDEVDQRTVLRIDCSPHIIDFEAMRIQLAKEILERNKCLFEIDEEAIKIIFPVNAA